MDSRAYRDVWGNFATGVTVITTDCDGWLHGMTANGVTSVSLDPTLMLVCVDKGARCHAQLSRAGAFGVSLLGEDQKDLSNLFARGGDPEEGALRGAAFHLGPNGTPLLDDSLAWLECRIHEIHEGGDHDIFVGEILAGDASEGQPLLFYSGKYARLST